MKARELREKSEDELQSQEAELKDQLLKLRFQKAMGQLEDKMKLRNVKKDVARIKTLLREIQKGKK